MRESVGREPRQRRTTRKRHLRLAQVRLFATSQFPPTSSANHNTQFYRAFTTGFSASQHFSTKSRSRTPSEMAIRCSFMMLIFRMPRSTPDMNVQCSPALSASCSCVKPSASRRLRIVFPKGFLGSVIGSSTHRCFRFQPDEYIVYSLCQGKSIVFNDFMSGSGIFLAPLRATVTARGALKPEISLRRPVASRSVVLQSV